MYRSLSQIADDLDRLAQSLSDKEVEALKNIRELALRDSMAAYPTPVVSDEALEFWADYYRKFEINKLGMYFLVFMQNPRFYVEVIK